MYSTKNVLCYQTPMGCNSLIASSLTMLAMSSQNCQLSLAFNLESFANNKDGRLTVLDFVIDVFLWCTCPDAHLIFQNFHFQPLQFLFGELLVHWQCHLQNYEELYYVATKAGRCIRSRAVIEGAYVLYLCIRTLRDRGFFEHAAKVQWKVIQSYMQQLLCTCVLYERLENVTASNSNSDELRPIIGHRRLITQQTKVIHRNSCSAACVGDRSLSSHYYREKGTDLDF